MTTLLFRSSLACSAKYTINSPAALKTVVFQLPLFQTTAMFLSKETQILFCFQIWAVLTSIVEVWLPQEARTTVRTIPVRQPDSNTPGAKFSPKFISGVKQEVLEGTFHELKGSPENLKVSDFRTLSYMFVYKSSKLNFPCSRLSVERVRYMLSEYV